MTKASQDRELRPLVGKRVRIERGDMKFEGILGPKSDRWRTARSAIATTMPATADIGGERLRLWALQSGGDTVHFAADDGWRVTPIP